MAASRRQSRSRAGHRSGFTLLEALVALIIFGVITFALSLALSTALRAQSAAQAHQEQAGTVRIVFDLLSRDIRAAYASTYDPNSIFIVGGGQSGSSGSNMAGASSGLLTLSTLDHVIQSGDPNVDPAAAAMASTGAAQAAGSNGDPPQWDCELVRYDLDSQNGVLYRQVTGVPSLTTISSSPSGDPGTIVAKDVISLTLSCWDPSQQTWRQDWDYEQQANASQTSGSQAGGGQAAGSTGSTGSSGQATGGANNATTTNQTTGDTNLPTAVRVTLVIRNKNGMPDTYTITIPVTSPYPLDQNSTTTTGSGQNGATSGTNTGQNGGTPQAAGGSQTGSG